MGWAGHSLGTLANAPCVMIVMFLIYSGLATWLRGRRIFWGKSCTDPSLVTTEGLADEDTLRNHDDHLDSGGEQGDFGPVSALAHLGLHRLDRLILHDAVDLVEQPDEVATEQRSGLLFVTRDASVVAQEEVV